MALDIQPIKTRYNLSSASRPLSKIEQEAEDNAVKFNIKEYKKVSPVVGTLAFLFRNFKGGNSAIFHLLKESLINNQQSGTSLKKIREVLILYNSADEYSQRRIDIWDILCEKVQLEKKKFWGILQESTFDYTKIISELSIMAHTPELIDNTFKFAKQDKNFKDRELAAKIAGIVKDKPLIEVNDNSTTNNLNIKDSNVGFSFSEMIKKGNNVIRQEETKYEIDSIREDRLLSEGQTEFIEGEEIREGKLVEK